jgi:CDP-diacylglycerol--serine O-phosphatidyltransferase
VKRIAIIPTLFTLGNAACGFAALLFAARVSIASEVSESLSLYISGWLIIAAMIFDMFDGYVARRVKSTSQFGAELDSLCDAVSFGVVPAFLLIRLGSGFEGRLARDIFFVAAMLYMVCVILRLARFNVQTSTDAKSHRMFTGLPSPAAAGCLVSLVIARFNLVDLMASSNAIINPAIDALAPLCAVVVALLMISRIPYIHVATRVLGRRRQHFSRLVQLILVVLAVILFRELAFVLMFWGYALAGPLLMLWKRSRLSAASDGTESEAPPSDQFAH